MAAVQFAMLIRAGHDVEDHVWRGRDDSAESDFAHSDLDGAQVETECDKYSIDLPDAHFHGAGRVYYRPALLKDDTLRVIPAFPKFDFRGILVLNSMDRDS
jgi:hypothetical protein